MKDCVQNECAHDCLYHCTVDDRALRPNGASDGGDRREERVSLEVSYAHMAAVCVPCAITVVDD